MRNWLSVLNVLLVTSLIARPLVAPRPLCLDAILHCAPPRVLALDLGHVKIGHATVALEWHAQLRLATAPATMGAVINMRILVLVEG